MCHRGSNSLSRQPLQYRGTLRSLFLSFGVILHNQSPFPYMSNDKKTLCACSSCATVIRLITDPWMVGCTVSARSSCELSVRRCDSLNNGPSGGPMVGCATRAFIVCRCRQLGGQILHIDLRLSVTRAVRVVFVDPDAGAYTFPLLSST